MTNDTNLATFRVVTAHDQIRELADSHGASPNVVERSDGRRQLSIERPTNGSAEALSWEQFFERFESTDQVLVYRPAEPNERDNPIFDVVDRDAVGIGDGDEPPGESVEDHTEPLATSDTGDHEPVAYDHGESVDHGDDEPEDASVAPAADTEHGPTAATEGLVLDEIHGAQSGMGRDVDDEFLVFENDGDQRLDLSGWVVHNDEGRSYRFPEGTTLAPREQVTLHSGDERDTEDHYYWGAGDPVWGDQRDTVTVETPAGERVLSVSYEV